MSGDMKRYYEENSRKVFLYLMTLCNDPDIAEELTQDTFYQALLSLRKYKGESSVFTWLCGIARNLWLREKRSRGRHPSAELPPDTPDTSAAPDRAAEEHDEAQRLAALIDALPERERQLVLLRSQGGLSFRELGELLGWSENGARVTYCRLRQRLKTELEKE
ncbi:MAG: sigma-70 family RNA polymerase sigma factor [Ruminococcus sp.]|nr:sigma-70 family RNA polymerase sigma factor [Ruminococcus sp.]